MNDRDRDLARLEEARQDALGEGVERNLPAGSLAPRTRIHHFVDADSFVEIGQLATSQQLGLDCPTPADGIITGFAKVRGRHVAIVADDPVVLASTDGQVGKAKRRRMLKLALQEGIPVVLLLDEPAGAPPVFDPLSGDMFGKLADQHDDPDLRTRRAPVISVAFSALRGQRLELALSSDIVIGTSGAIGSVQGVVPDFVADTDGEALAQVVTALDLLSGTRGAAVAREERVPPAHEGCDLDDVTGLALVAALVDDGDTLVVTPGPGETLTAGLVRMGGFPHVVTATGCAPGQALVAADVRRLHRAVGWSRRWLLPLLVIQDCPGYDAALTDDPEVARLVNEVVERLRSSHAPIVVLVVGDGHVLGTYCLGGRQLAPTFVGAWPWARLPVTDPPRYEHDVLSPIRQADPWLAAGLGMIDEIMLPEETGPFLRWLAELFHEGGRLPPHPEEHRWYARGSIKGV